MALVCSDSLGTGTFAPSIGVITPVVESQTQVEPVAMVLDTHARLTLRIPAPTLPKLNLRTMPGRSFVATPPAIVGGQPRTPRFWGQVTPGGQALAGIGHLRGFADPDPVWDGAAWTVAPPPAPAGSHFIRWTTRSLPNPAGFPGGSYLLGDAEPKDGTATITTGARQWPSAPGSDYSIPWQSKYPFKPTVKNHVHYGTNGSLYTESAGVHFTPRDVSHMWADFGTLLTPPFTLIMVAVVTDFPTKSYLNYLFDTGEDPSPDLTQAQKDDIWAHGVTGQIALTESFGYRTGLRVGRSAAYGFNDPVPTTRIARAPFTHTTKPKMFACVFNNASSSFSVWDTAGHSWRNVKLISHGAQRLLLMGRANGILSALMASSMVVFEIRAWDMALSWDQVLHQYESLSSTWKFHSYK